MEHQYPTPISGDESMLAELMLPDQTHVRSQDWTIFFLHKDTSADGDDDDSVSGKKKKKRKGKRNDQEGGEGDGTPNEDAEEASEDDESSEDEEEGGEGPPLMYVLNLVNTKQDNTAKRYVPQSESLNCFRLWWLTGLQWCGCEIHGDLYAAFIPSHIQGDSPSRPGKGCSSDLN